jgi:hypothetical protein
MFFETISVPPNYFWGWENRRLESLDARKPGSQKEYRIQSILVFYPYRLIALNKPKIKNLRFDRSSRPKMRCIPAFQPPSIPAL